MLSACQFLTRADCPGDYALAAATDPGAVLMRGGGGIVGPLGAAMAGPCFAREATLTAEVDLAEIVRGKYDFDATGHYARPDVFRLTVNERPMPAVTFTNDGGV